jgi:class III poly(R)-hydroxyalkanoic acid synthase PhaE subunit
MIENSHEKILDHWFEMQNEVIDFWKGSIFPNASTNNAISESSKKANGSSSGPEFDYPKELFEHWSGYYNQLMAQGKKFFNLGNHEDSWQKILNSTEVYNNLYRFWKELAQEITGDNKNQITRFYDKWQNQYIRIFSNGFMPFMPQLGQGFFKEIQEINQMYADTIGNFFKPVIKNLENVQSFMFKGLAGDKDSFMNFIKFWRESYENTLSKLLNAPNMGINREVTEKQFDFIDKLIRYAVTANEFSAVIYKVGMENFEEILNKYQQLVQKGEHPKTFKEFYQLWWTTNEEAYFNLFRTPKFSKLLSEVVDAGMVFKQNQDALLEEYFKSMPVPVKSEMNSLYKTVYDLKRDTRKLKNEMKELNKKLDNRNNQQ